jgi:hypothetical protein
VTDSPREISDGIKIDLELVIGELESLVNEEPLMLPSFVDNLKLLLFFVQILPLDHDSLIFFFGDSEDEVLKISDPL